MAQRRGERIGTILPEVLKRAAAQHRPLFAIQRRWRRLVGKQLAAHTRPVGLRRGRLIVQTDQPGDSFALNYGRAQLLERIQAAACGQVEEIVIRVGDVHSGKRDAVRH